LTADITFSAFRVYAVKIEISHRNKKRLIAFFTGDPQLANHKSALKRARQSEIRRIRNKSYKTTARNTIKGVRNAVNSNALEKAEEGFVKAVSVLQKTASKGVIHKNKAARQISRLARQVNQLS
jgi:small subunit ribosomal protein S20